MQLLIQSQDFEMAEELKNSAPKGVSVTVHQKMTRSADSISTAIVFLEFIRDKSVEIDIALLAAWLYDKTKKDKTCQIGQGRKKVVKTKAGIGRWIQEELDIGKND
jgi:hypothetical protein